MVDSIILQVKFLTIVGGNQFPFLCISEYQYMIRQQSEEYCQTFWTIHAVETQWDCGLVKSSFQRSCFNGLWIQFDITRQPQIICVYSIQMFQWGSFRLISLTCWAIQRLWEKQISPNLFYDCKKSGIEIPKNLTMKVMDHAWTTEYSNFQYQCR